MQNDIRWPAAQNTLKVTISLNMDLLTECQPIIKISRLEGACINSNHAALAGNDEAKFTSVNASSVEDSDWDAEMETLSLRAQPDEDFTAGPHILSNTAYSFEFDIKNPVFGQEGTCLISRGIGINFVPFPPHEHK